jgi:hypothetical protein
MASEDFDFFKKIFTLSRDTFDENVKSYEISANPALVPDLTKVTPEAAVEAITENPDLRQMLHIAFGVVLKEYGAQLRHSLRDHSEQYREHLTQHLGKHVKLLSGDKNKQQ